MVTEANDNDTTQKRFLIYKRRGGSSGRVQGGEHPPPWDDLWFSNTTGILQKKTMWFIGVEVEQETIASPPKKNPRSAPEATISLKSDFENTRRNWRPQVPIRRIKNTECHLSKYH